MKVGNILLTTLVFLTSGTHNPPYLLSEDYQTPEFYTDVGK